MGLRALQYLNLNDTTTDLGLLFTALPVSHFIPPPLFSVLCVQRGNEPILTSWMGFLIFSFLLDSTIEKPCQKIWGEKKCEVRVFFRSASFLRVTMGWQSSHCLIDDPLNIPFSHQLTSSTYLSPFSYRTRNGNNSTAICPWVFYYFLWFSYILPIFLLIVLL